MAILFIYYSMQDKKNVNKEALEDLNLQLIGIVYKIDDPGNFNGTGIANLKIISSSIKNYDPRGKQDYYYCLIKNGQAEIYSPHVKDLTFGDTVFIDTKSKIIRYKYNGSLVKGNIFVNTSSRFYDYIKRHHQKL